MNNRIEIMHGVNLDMLGRRDPEHYGTITLPELERLVGDYATEVGLSARFYQTNHEGDFVEHLHRLEGMADAVILNPGAWTHYAWALHDALEIVQLPAVEVHLSNPDAREPWRHQSVLADLCLARVTARGPEGYREALERLAAELGS